MERRQSWRHIKAYRGQIRRDSTLGLRNTALRIPLDLQREIREEMEIQGYKAKSKFILKAVRHYLNLQRVRRGQDPL